MSLPLRLLFLSFLAFHVGCQISDEETDACFMTCPVYMIYKPVCGTDGDTYENHYVLECDRKCRKLDVEVAYNGRCKGDEDYYADLSEEEVSTSS